jgi:uncharacterized protein
MTRSDMLLAILAAAGGRAYTPVQIQKAAFLVTENIPHIVENGPNYEFEPYDYGPFDQQVYGDAETLQRDGHVEIVRQEGSHWNRYAASEDGVAMGEEILATLAERDRQYIRTVSQWVRGQSFERLVKSIYDAYPRMKANSVFRG